MRALYFDGKCATLLCDYPEPGSSDSMEATVRVTLAGICGTDIEMLHGYMDYSGVMGHEFVGVIVDSAGGKYKGGQRVVGEINAACNACSMCQRNLQRHCPSRTVLGIQGRDGAFAQMLCLPSENIHAVPDAISDKQAVFIEPLAAAFEITEQLSIHHQMSDVSGWRAAVVGDGRLAHLVCQVLHRTCRDVTCFGRHYEKLDWLKNKLKINTKIGIDSKYDVNAFDLVVDVSGSATGFADAMRLVRPRGTLVLKSTVAANKQAGGMGADLTQVIIDEVVVMGSRCGLFKPAIDALAAGMITVEHMQGEVFGLEEFQSAVRRAKEPDALKVYLDPHAVMPLH